MPINSTYPGMVRLILVTLQAAAAVPVEGEEAAARNRTTCFRKQINDNRLPANDLRQLSHPSVLI
jgi:hypothetical protein